MKDDPIPASSFIPHPSSFILCLFDREGVHGRLDARQLRHGILFIHVVQTDAGYVLAQQDARTDKEIIEVFLDDAPGNVAGAQAAGLHAILVDAADPKPALAELDALLGRT